MGWRERDYARFTDEERRRFFATAPTGTSRAGGRSGVTRGAGAAVLVSGVLFALGQLPRNHPIVPALHFRIPASKGIAQPRLVHAQPLRLPPSMPRGSVLTIRGHIGGFDGRLITLEAHWRRGAWRAVAVRRIPPGGTFRVAIRAKRRGLLRLRLSYPNGATAAGKTLVR